MNTDAETLISLLGIAGALIIFYGPWQGLCVDYARQIVFEQRDKLFDMAADGRIAFEAPEYRKIRMSLEALIRFAHDVTIWKMLYLNFFDKQRDEDSVSIDPYEVAQSIKDDVLSKEVGDLILNATGAVALMMMARSALLLVAILVSPIILLISLVFIGWKAALKQCKRIFLFVGQAIQAEAETFCASS